MTTERKRHERLVAALTNFAPDAQPLDQICRGSLSVLGVTGAAIILMSTEEVGRTVVASSATASAVEDLQFTLGEGPALIDGALSVAELRPAGR